jgi:predicted outer membrane protein
MIGASTGVSSGWPSDFFAPPGAPFATGSSQVLRAGAGTAQQPNLLCAVQQRTLIIWEMLVQINAVRSLAAALAISTVVACAHRQYDSSSAGGSLSLANPPVPPLADAEVQLLRRMSDANILGHFAMIDSVEVQLSQHAMAYSLSDAVLAYAHEMDAAYRNATNRDHELGQQTGLGLTTMAGDLQRSHLGPAIDSVALASDRSLDRNYTLSQIQLHQHELAEMEILQSVARNSVIREHLMTRVPMIRDELARAHAIAVTKGYEAKKNASM